MLGREMRAPWISLRPSPSHPPLYCTHAARSVLSIRAGSVHRPRLYCIPQSRSQRERPSTHPPLFSRKMLGQCMDLLYMFQRTHLQSGRTCPVTITGMVHHHIIRFVFDSACPRHYDVAFFTCLACRRNLLEKYWSTTTTSATSSLSRREQLSYSPVVWSTAESVSKHTQAG